MATQAELNAKIDEVAATLAAEIEQIKEALEAKVPDEIDLSAEVAKLDGLAAAIAAIIPDAEPEPVAEVPPTEELPE